MIFISSPYSHPDVTVEQKRFELVQGFTAALLRDEYIVFSPIVYGHMLAKAFKLPTDAGFWDHFNMSMLRRANAMYVLRIPGWQESKGVQRELSVAQTLYIPTTFFDISADGTGLRS